jgi:hypothetical protein
MVATTAVAARNKDDGKIDIDIRVFLALITVIMVASFVAGVFTVPMDTLAATLREGDAPSAARDNFLSNVSQEESKKIEDEHRPSGQHLLVDIKGVEAEFLNSEERLSKALVDTVKEAG